MCLQAVRLWVRRSARRLRPSCAHIRAYMPNAGQSVVTFDMQRTQESLRCRLSFIKSALALHVHPHCSARRQALGGRDGLRSQPVRSARERKRPAADFRCLWPVSAPRVLVGYLNRRAIMRTADTLPGESNTQIISSTINLVCPQCGGRMSEFQCEGRCRRNWLKEWEWANYATTSSQSRVSGHRARSTR